MKTIIALLLLLPHDPLPTVHTDIIESNRVYSQSIDPADGEVICTERMHQLIYWGAFPGSKQIFVREWSYFGEASIDLKTNSVITPNRIIRAGAVIETHTTHDPEIDDRSEWPEAFRFKLR